MYSATSGVFVSALNAVEQGISGNDDPKQRPPPGYWSSASESRGTKTIVEV